MPTVYEYMSHQIIDVSTVMTFINMNDPSQLIKRPRIVGMAHRAMADVEYSIQTLKYLNDTVYPKQTKKRQAEEISIST